MLLILALLAVTAAALGQQPGGGVDKAREEAVRKALMQSGQLGPGDTLILHEHREEATATGAGGVASGDKVDHKFEGSAPSVTLPGAGASGGSSRQDGTAAMVTNSGAFRWIAGIVGVIAIALGFYIGKGGNVRGALVVGGSGVGLLVGAIFFPAWLAVGLLLFFVASVGEYAWRHGALTGTIASFVSGLQDAGKAGVTAMAAVRRHVEPAEVPIINQAAKHNEAPHVKV